MIEIPLLNVPNQRLQCTLGQQDCTIHVYQRGKRVYMDLDLDDTTLFVGAICLPGVQVGGSPYPFRGALIWSDDLAAPDKQQPPQYEGFRSRWRLLYGTEAEMADIIAEETLDG